MKGTEKQIIWATEIKDRVSSILRDGIVEQKKTHPENIGNIKGFESMLNIVTDFDGYAGEMIETFSDIRRTGDPGRDVYNVVMASRATRIFPIQSGELGKQLRAIFEFKYEGGAGMTIAQERLFKQMGGREAYDEFNRLAPAWAAKLEAEYTRLFDLAEDRTMEEDAQYLGKVNPAKGIAKWNVIKSWQDAIEWWIAHPEKLYLTEDPKEALTRNESPVM